MSLLILFNQPSSSGPATDYTMSLSSSSGVDGSTTTIFLTGNGTTSALVTLHIAGITGVFSQATIHLNNTSTVSLTFTSSSVGVGTISATNDGGLDDPGGQTYTSTTPGGEVIVVTQAYHLVGTGTSWNGTPFSLVNPGGATITYQLVISNVSAFIEISANGNLGPYTISDGSVNDIDLPMIVPVASSTTLIVVSPQAGGRG